MTGMHSTMHLMHPNYWQITIMCCVFVLLLWTYAYACVCIHMILCVCNYSVYSSVIRYVCVHVCVCVCVCVCTTKGALCVADVCLW